MKMPKRLQAQSEAHARAPAQERATAKRAGGVAVPQSGAGIVKGDVRVSGIARIECKTTTRKSYAIKPELVDKLESACLGAGEIPIVEIEFLGPRKRTLCVVPHYVLDMLTERKTQ